MILEFNKVQVFKILLFFFFFTRSSIIISQGYLTCVGGGAENYNNWSDAPYGWLVAKADSGKILVLHYSSGSTWLEDYFKWLGAMESESLVISSRTAAKDSSNYFKILKADGIFLRGGDQWKYVSLWNDTPVENALQQVFNRGGVIGGTSAGLAVLGGTDFVASNGSAISERAIRTPFYSRITLSNTFLPLAPAVIFDSHFTERARFGRLLAMQNYWKFYHSENLLGIGIDDRTALCIEPSGKAAIMGSGSVFFYNLNGRLSEPGKPLLLENIYITQAVNGFIYNLSSSDFSEIPNSAVPFEADSFSIEPATNMILVPGVGQNDLKSLSTLIQLFQYSFDSKILILTNNIDLAKATEVLGGLQGLGFSGAIEIEPVFMDNLNDTALTDKVKDADILMLVGLSNKEAPDYFASQTLFGAGWETAISEKKLIVFLNENTKLLGPVQILGTETSKYAAYRGQLFSAVGLNLMPILVIPKVFNDFDYDENRTDALLWGIAEHQIPLGLYLDDDCAVALSAEGKMTVAGDAPIMFIDTRETKWRDFSKWRSSPKYKTRQSVALVDYKMNVIPAGYEYDILTDSLIISEVKEKGTDLPANFDLEVFPNPAKDILTIRFPQNLKSEFQVIVYNLLGRKVAAYKVESGYETNYYKQLKLPENLSPGCYFIKLISNSNIQFSKLIILN